MRLAFVMIVFTALLFGAAVNATVFSSQEWGSVSPEERLLQAPPEAPDAGAVFIFDKGFVVVELDGPTLTRHVRVKILDTAIIPRLTPVIIESVWYDEIFDVEALVHRADGSLFKVDKKSIVEFKDQSRRTRTISFPDLKVGDIVEYRYSISYYGGIDKLGAEKYFLFSQAVDWQWVKDRKDNVVEWDAMLASMVANIPAWYFDNIGSTMYSEYTVKIGADLDYSCVPSNLPPDKREPVSRRGKGIIERVYVYHTWTLEDVAADRPEPFMSRPNDYRPSLHFDLFSTAGLKRIIMGDFAEQHWNYVGRNFQGYLSEYLGKLREVKSEAIGVVEGLTSDEGKTRRLYEHVRDNYAADSAGYRMRAAGKNMAEFRKRKSGAPFEANILLVEMLKAVGIKAWPVLISTRSEAPFRRTGRFNHMIVYASLDLGGIYMDASSKACRYGALPSNCLVAEGVLVDFDASRKQAILAAAQENFRIDSIRLDFDGAVWKCGLKKATLSGYPAMEFQSTPESASPQDGLLGQGWLVDDLRLSDSLMWSCDSLGQCLIQATVSPDDLVEGTGGAVALPVARWLSSCQFTSEHRTQPVDFVYPFIYESTAILAGGDSTRVAASISDEAFKLAGASYLRQSLQRGDSVVVTIRLAVDKSVFAPQEYLSLRSFLARAVEVSARPLLGGPIRP